MQAFIGHGGRLDAARCAFPGAPLPWIDLSTGLNPRPWQPPADLAVDPGPLPERAALRGLEAAAARHLGVAPERVAAVPGSEVALRLLAALGLPAPLIAMRGGYRSHRDVAGQAIGRSAIGKAPPGTLLIAHPDNPDGRLLDAADVARLLARPGWSVIDEAFAEAVPGCGVLSAIDADARVIVLRSFGKFFGLAGVRLGFVVAPPAILARMRRLLGDWPVSAQAIAWGTLAYRDDAWITATRAALAAAARQLDALLARHGLAATGACPLFRLVGHPDAALLFGRLARAGILTRPFADRPDRLRLGLPADAAAFDRLERALADG